MNTGTCSRLGAGLLLLLANATAQAAEAGDRLLKQDIDRREQERREQRWDEAHTPSTVPAPKPAPSPEPTAPTTSDGPCFPVQEIRLQPANILAASAVRRVQAQWSGRCLHAADLAQIQESLNAAALAQGLVTTRVVIPEQNLASGVLQLTVWPGHIEALQATGLHPRELFMANPAQVGDLLQLRALEQAVDNLNRLASFQSSLQLLPGEAPGSSRVDFSVQKKRPWQAGFSWQGEAVNGDAPSNSLRANLTVDSPLRLADRLMLGINANLQDMQVDDANGGSIDYDLPLGWWRLSAGADRFDYENNLQAGITHFRATGESRSWRAELARSLWRDARHRLSLALHHKQRISDNYIDTVTVGISSYRVQATGLRVDYSCVAAPWIVDASLDAEDGEAVSAAAQSPFASNYQRSVLSTRLQYQRARASVSAAINAQWSAEPLVVSEQFSLSGQVPGYSPLSLTADRAVAARLEAAYALALQRAGFTQLRPSLALNWAHTPELAGSAQAVSVQSASAGLTLSWRQAVARMAAAFPINDGAFAPPQRWQLDAGFSVQW